MASTKNLIKPARIYYQVRFDNNGFDIKTILRQFKGAEQIECINELVNKNGIKEKDLKYFYNIDKFFENRIYELQEKGVIVYISQPIEHYNYTRHIEYLGPYQRENY